jgi:hypothetical protein
MSYPCFMPRITGRLLRRARSARFPVGCRFPCLERIADLAVNIAEHAVRLAELPASRSPPGVLPVLADKAVPMGAAAWKGQMPP